MNYKNKVSKLSFFLILRSKGIAAKGGNDLSVNKLFIVAH